jgi:CHAT domain-containing protein/Tfp pilus assembly protein PilF
MQRWIIPIFCIVFTLITFSQSEKEDNKVNLTKAYQAAEKRYKQANLLADKAGDNQVKIAESELVYNEALTGFTVLLPQLKKAGLDSLFLLAAAQSGIIHHYFDSLGAALTNYLTAIKAKDQLPSLPDSLIFQPLVFAGSIYYNSGAFDSASFYLKKAAAVKAKYSVRLHEETRLYNLLGVMYYETGDLEQSKNYIEKAIELLASSSSPDRTLAINYQLNIASILIKLEKYAEAEKILKPVVNDPIYENEVRHKLGYIKLKKAAYADAIGYFNKTNYSTGKKTTDLFINISMAYKGLGETDSADYYLLKAKTENLKWNGNKKTVTNGIILKAEADNLADAGNYREAIPFYQKALSNFSNSFTDTATSNNPANYTGVFAYFDLFYTLVAKADALQNIYLQEKNIHYLEVASATYQSAFTLTDYVEKTYNSDESRLFLNNIKYNVHSKPIETSLTLYEITNKKKYLTEAYLFDQKNKASTLSLSIRENDIKSQNEETNELIRNVVSIRKNITRLSLKAASSNDSLAVKNLLVSIRDQEIELDKLQEKIKNDPTWQQLNLQEQIPSVNNLQRKLDNNSAIISYHLSAEALLAIVITRTKLEYYQAPLDKFFQTDIELFKKSLHTTSGEKRYEGAVAAKRLYSKLIKPLQSKLAQTERLIIIPDDELHYLPFEALQDDNNNYLLQRFSVQYLFSTALFQSEKDFSLGSGTLSFAPFAGSGYTDSSGTSFSKLAASGDEINNLSGMAMKDSSATKQNFLSYANHYPVIHLATHASVSTTDAGRSFIAFYPGTADYKLYAQEIYNLRLDSTELIILSACETGTGKLIKGEGLMSLSRAFAYAGCTNIITSLWKAEDVSTSFITKRLHHYLAKGYTKDKALQVAKLDLLKSDEISPGLKTPNYWAQLLFIGDYKPGSSSSNWPWIALGIILISFIYLWRMRKNPA